MKKHAISNPCKMKNGALVNIPADRLQESFALFFQNPLPILARIDLKIALDLLFKRIAILNEAYIALMKKHGAVEKGNEYSLSAQSPGWSAFKAEYEAFAAREFELPVEKISIPVRVMVAGKLVDIVATEPAASILEQIVEWVR